jgi:hypothetical protein
MVDFSRRRPIPPARHSGAAKICFISGQNMLQITLCDLKHIFAVWKA